MALAFGLLWWAVQTGATTVPDAAVGEALGLHHTGALAHAGALWVTQMGTGAVGCAVALSATALLASSARSALVAPLWVTFLGAEATAWGVKFLLGRPRPTFIETVAEVSPSFPSAHATTAVAVYGFVALAAAMSLDGPARRAVIAGAALLALLIGASRVVLSVHYLTDVLGGYLVGGAWLLAALALLPPGPDRNQAAPPASGS